MKQRKLTKKTLVFRQVNIQRTYAILGGKHVKPKSRPPVNG